MADLEFLHQMILHCGRIDCLFLHINLALANLIEQDLRLFWWQIDYTIDWEL